jgi:hypothetical protein
MFVLGTLAENHGQVLQATPIFDDEHTTKTSKDGLWFDPIQSAMGEGALTVVSGGDARRDERSISEGLMNSFVRRSGFQDSPFASSSLGKSILAEESAHAASAEVIKLPSVPEPSASTGMTQQQKVAAALLRAGISNPAAWAASGIADATTKLPESGANGFDSQPATVIMKGRNQSTFLISWRSQREVARSLGWKCVAMIWGGPALAVLSLWGLLTLIHVI